MLPTTSMRLVSIFVLLLPLYIIKTVHARPTIPKLEARWTRPWQNETGSTIFWEQVKNPSEIFSVMLIIGGDIVQKAVAQMSGHNRVTLTAFSFGWVSYAFSTLMSALGDGTLMPNPEFSSEVINVSSGIKKSNNSWVLSRLIRDLESVQDRSEPWHEVVLQDKSDGIDESFLIDTNKVDVKCRKVKEDSSRLLIHFYKSASNGVKQPNQRNFLIVYAITTIAQHAIAATATIRYGNWSILLITFLGSVLAILTGSTKEWRLEKYQCRGNTTHTYALTRGNGHMHVFIVQPGDLQPDGKYPGLYLDDLAGAVPKADKWTRRKTGIAAFGWVLFLIICGGVKENTWFLLIVGLLGMIENIWVAGHRRKSTSHGIPLEYEATIGYKTRGKLRQGVTTDGGKQVFEYADAPKVMRVLMDVEEKSPGLGQALLPEFFPNAVYRDDEETFWKDKKAPFLDAISVNKFTTAVTKNKSSNLQTEMVSLLQRTPQSTQTDQDYFDAVKTALYARDFRDLKEEKLLTYISHTNPSNAPLIDAPDTAIGASNAQLPSYSFVPFAGKYAMSDTTTGQVIEHMTLGSDGSIRFGVNGEGKAYKAKKEMDSGGAYWAVWGDRQRTWHQVQFKSAKASSSGIVPASFKGFKRVGTSGQISRLDGQQEVLSLDDGKDNWVLFSGLRGLGSSRLTTAIVQGVVWTVRWHKDVSGRTEAVTGSYQNTRLLTEGKADADRCADPSVAKLLSKTSKDKKKSFTEDLKSRIVQTFADRYTGGAPQRKLARDEENHPLHADLVAKLDTAIDDAATIFAAACDDEACKILESQKLVPAQLNTRKTHIKNATRDAITNALSSKHGKYGGPVERFVHGAILVRDATTLYHLHEDAQRSHLDAVEAVNNLNTTHANIFTDIVKLTRDLHNEEARDTPSADRIKALKAEIDKAEQAMRGANVDAALIQSMLQCLANEETTKGAARNAKERSDAKRVEKDRYVPDAVALDMFCRFQGGL